MKENPIISELSYIQPELRFHEPESKFLAYHQFDAVVLETHHYKLHGSSHQESTRCILWSMQDVERGTAHWQVVFWCIFQPIWRSKSCTFYLLLTTCIAPSFNRMVTWSKVAVTCCIRYSWILEMRAHSNLPSFVVYLINAPFTIIHIFSSYSWYGGMRQLDSELEWLMWLTPVIFFYRRRLCRKFLPHVIFNSRLQSLHIQLINIVWQCPQMC